jgi:hypothetical protein
LTYVIATFVYLRVGIMAEVGWGMKVLGYRWERKRPTALRRRKKMKWEIVVALALMAPIILLPVAFVGYLTVGGIYAAVRETRRAGRKAKVTA